jgi:predicted nucleic acid-binding protein
MSVYTTTEFRAEVGSRAMIVDTNVLVAAFLVDDQNHSDARTFLFELADQVIIPSAVLVETWGMLVGSKGRTDLGLALLEWIDDPGKGVVLVPSHGDCFSDVRELAETYRIDCVDAILVGLALELSTKCRQGRPVQIATFDTRDFLRVARSKSTIFNVFDLKTFDDLTFRDI